MTSDREQEYRSSKRSARCSKQARIGQGAITIAKLRKQAGIAVGQVHKLENDQVKKVNPAHLSR